MSAKTSFVSTPSLKLRQERGTFITSRHPSFFVHQQVNFNHVNFSTASNTIKTYRRAARMVSDPETDSTSSSASSSSDPSVGAVSNAGADSSSSDSNVETSISSGEDVIFDDEIKEPYPGFFGDMRRMGMSDEEARAQAIKQMKQSKPTKSDKVGGKKNLFREDGTPYAPWMANFPSEYNNTVIKKRTDATGRLAADPQRGELSGVGLTYRMIGDDTLELMWATGSEEGNKGFVVYRRRGKSDNWEKIDDYRTNPNMLLSKGTKGGKYAYSVENPEPGTWVYRVSDCDEQGNVADLAQLLVEIESPEDSKLQKIALVALLVVLGIAVAVGIFLDPQSSVPQ